jgi:hypothetical protein
MCIPSVGRGFYVKQLPQTSECDDAGVGSCSGSFRCANEYLAGWGENGAVDAIPEAAELIDVIAARIENAAGLKSTPAAGERDQRVAA